MRYFKHQEIELKYKADHLTVEQVGQALFNFGDRPTGYKEVLHCPDFYYTNDNGDVIRHRLGDNGGTLTTKARKTDKSITNRHEVDLHLDASFSEATQFIKMIGFKPEFTIMKSSWIWYFQDKLAHVTVALYDVTLWDKSKQAPAGATQRFFEVEVERGTYDSEEIAAKTLKYYKNYVENELSLDKPLSMSLYEMFSGKSYNIRKA